MQQRLEQQFILLQCELCFTYYKVVFGKCNKLKFIFRVISYLDRYEETDFDDDDSSSISSETSEGPRNYDDLIYGESASAYCEPMPRRGRERGRSFSVERPPTLATTAAEPRSKSLRVKRTDEY